MPEFYFEPVARLQRYLGKELIADPNMAVIEFVKNAYDANASQVLVHFQIRSRSKEEQVITISDDGIGMDVTSFEKNWMHPGYSSKAKLAETLASSASTDLAPDMLEQRIPVGEKGLGRLAAGRLGDRIHIYTRTQDVGPWLHIYVDWTQFDTMDQPLNRIPVTYEETPTRTGSGFPKGTIVLIEQLCFDWTGKLPGRRPPGRSGHRLGRLREDLSVLLQPLPQKQRRFAVYLSSDADELKKYNGWVKPSELSFLDYEFKVTITGDEHGIHIDRQVKRSAHISDKVGQPRLTESGGSPSELYGPVERENLPTGLVCGPFSSVLHYSPASTKRLRELNIGPGVFLYRDGVRVEPYGQEGNDWLGVTAWKASRQGYAPIQPKNLNGYFTISRIANPELRDMSNREGLIDSDAYRTFIALATSEFRWFADLVFFEYVRPGWESSEAKAQRAAQSRTLLGVSIVKSIAHSVRQATAGLGAELGNIEGLVERYPIPPEMKDELLEATVRSWDHLDNIDQTIGRFLKFDQEELVAPQQLKEIVLQEALQEAVYRTEPLAHSLGVRLEFKHGPPHKLVFGEEALVITAAALISNGIEAASCMQRGEGLVRISTVNPPTDWYEVLIEDNGQGVNASSIDELLSRPLSEKGRPGAGLMLTKEAIALAGGKVSLQSTSSTGSVFKISLPKKPKKGS